MSDEETEGRTMASIRDRNYAKIQYLDSEGNLKTTQGNGDAVAMALLGIGADELPKICKANGIEFSEKANNGQTRMAVGNSLRAMVKRGEPITIGDITVKKLDQKVIPPSIKAAAEHIKQRDKDKATAAKDAGKATTTKAKLAAPAAKGRAKKAA